VALRSSSSTSSGGGGGAQQSMLSAAALRCAIAMLDRPLTAIRHLVSLMVADANPLDSTRLEGLAMHASSSSLLLKHLLPTHARNWLLAHCAK